MKLPKQWKHWARSMRLHPHKPRGRTSRGVSWLYLQGRGRYWRVNMYGVFQCGDLYDRFDRWALCQNITEAPLPKTRAEFQVTVRRLLAAK